PEGVEELRKLKEVAYIEEDRMVTYAPPSQKGKPSGGGSSAQETPYGISRVNGGEAYTGSNVAWVVDTGIDLDHEDLNVDASRGFNAFTSGKDGRSLDDGNGHGTHVAGTIAALDNNVGVIGVAAGATVVPVKVLDSRGSGSYSGVVAGVDYIGANGSNGDVANMSLGGPVSEALDDAVKAASASGVKFVLAAGNESDDANNHSPARVNGANIYTISAVDINDNFASFSNFGNPPVDYAAPGVAIKSTWKGGGYNTISGTSMASPHAAGVLLLGNASTSGTANGDPDGNADAIIVR
ncbi:MAG: S8 family peptidase, partial [Gramella sp.]|nr:S8 family peptidase [Christiangramia sp.]